MKNKLKRIQRYILQNQEKFMRRKDFVRHLAEKFNLSIFTANQYISLMGTKKSIREIILTNKTIDLLKEIFNNGFADERKLLEIFNYKKLNLLMAYRRLVELGFNIKRVESSHYYWNCKGRKHKLVIYKAGWL